MARDRRTRCTRTGSQRHITGVERPAVLAEQTKARYRPPGAGIEDEERLAPLAEHPAIAPLSERGQHRDEILPLGGELVLVAVPVHVRTAETCSAPGAVSGHDSWRRRAAPAETERRKT